MSEYVVTYEDFLQTLARKKEEIFGKIHVSLVLKIPDSKSVHKY